MSEPEITRQEALELSGISPGRLSYLDSTGLVVPKKVGNPKHPVVTYEWEQILQIKLVDRLRGKLSLQEIRKAIQFLRSDYKPSLCDANLTYVSGELYFVENAKQFQEIVLAASEKHQGQLVIHQFGAIADVIAELQAHL